MDALHGTPLRSPSCRVAGERSGASTHHHLLVAVPVCERPPFRPLAADSSTISAHADSRSGCLALPQVYGGAATRAHVRRPEQEPAR